MNKSELIDNVAELTNLSKEDARHAVDAFMTSIAASLKRGDSVSLVGFGTFSVKNRAARMGRNPATGATIRIRAGKTPSFKPGKALKEDVTGGGGPGIKKE